MCNYANDRHVTLRLQFLETLPPVDLFSNLEFLVNASSTPIPGLPTHEELADWMKQHDAIEQEAERFDSNDMKRLKKFAKGSNYGGSSIQ